MNKSKQDNLSRKHRFSGKKNKAGSKKPGKPWNKQMVTGEEPAKGNPKKKSLPTEDLRPKKKVNGGLADVNSLKQSSQHKPFGQNEKSLPAKEKKTDRHSLKSVGNRKIIKQQTPQKPLKVDRPQKRKKHHAEVPKPKRNKRSQSESDSDADDYMERFFQDVSDADPEDDLSGSVESDSSGSESMEDESDGGNGMSLEELVDFYGKERDRAVKQKQAGGKTGSTVKRKPKASQGNDWIEEDRDVDLIYEDSDGEEDSGCRALVPAGNGPPEESALSEGSGEEEEDDDEWVSLDEYTEEDDSDYQDETASDEDEYIGDDDFDYQGETTLDDESVISDSDYSESDGEDYESELDDHEFSSDYDSDYSDELDDYPSYWDESYDSAEDEDYVAEGVDDLYISRGTAQIYEIDDNQVSFNSDVDTAQIVELPCDDGRKHLFATTETDNATCPQLVPIYDAEGNLIDSHEKLERSKIVETTSSRKTTLLVEEAEASVTLGSSSKLAEPMDEDVDQDALPDSNYRVYDSIDMRMSLLVLKETLYFSGHLTIQPLVGGLEVMGYYLRPGECQSVYAVRGFHSLNLSPLPEAAHSSVEMTRKIMTRVEKHFTASDLQEIQKHLDPAVSVLVLLQADCNNKKISVVDKYLSEDLLFPKVEFLKRSAFFTSEYLLNVEFFTEHVDKSTSLYRSDPEWDKIDVKKNSKIVVMGGKASGKSTLCQYLVNKNVAKFRKVVLIDLDIGQPIQHIPETISVTIVDRPLLGVATFSPIRPLKSWLFGSLNIVSSLIFYIQNVRQLHRFCEQHQSELANVPWIINTMGYVSDFGEELMAVILRMFSPTDVIQLVSTNKLLAIPNYQNRLTCEFINQYGFNILRSEVQEYVQRKATFKHYELNVCYPKKGFTLNAPKRRSLMLLAHLADILHDTSSEWFNDVKPFCAPLSQLQVLITREDQTLADEQLPSVLNATLVYLCQKVDGGMYECLGIGIVRGVDKNNNVYLLQSLATERLASVNVLAICSSSLPNAVFLRQSTRIQGSIPYVYNID